jgi:hypothetical protein
VAGGSFAQAKEVTGKEVRFIALLDVMSFIPPSYESSQSSSYPG